MDKPSTSKNWMPILVLFNLIFIAIIAYLLLVKPSSDFLETTQLNIKNKEGANRVVIANEEHFPKPIINGKEYERQVVPAGLLFYDKKGDERGGIVMSEKDGVYLNAIAFDYQNADAIGLYAQDNMQTNYFKAGLTINDKDLSGKPGYNINRINLATEEGNAALIIKDNNETPRLVIQVDSLGTPAIVLYDSEGKVTWKSP